MSSGYRVKLIGIEEIIMNGKERKMWRWNNRSHLAEGFHFLIKVKV